jgi:hypothetical protein
MSAGMKMAIMASAALNETFALAMESLPTPAARAAAISRYTRQIFDLGSRAGAAETLSVIRGDLADRERVRRNDGRVAR